MSERALFGGAGGSLSQLDRMATDDLGAPVYFSGRSQIFSPNGWRGEAVVRTGVVLIETNALLHCRLTPIREGVVLDGTAGAEDARVLFTVTPFASPTRTLVPTTVGFFVPLRIGGVVRGSQALRARFLQFLLETTAIPVSGDAIPDVRFAGIELQWDPAGAQAPVSGP